VDQRGIAPAPMAAITTRASAPCSTAASRSRSVCRPSHRSSYPDLCSLHSPDTCADADTKRGHGQDPRAQLIRIRSGRAWLVSSSSRHLESTSQSSKMRNSAGARCCSGRRWSRGERTRGRAPGWGSNRLPSRTRPPMRLHAPKPSRPRAASGPPCRRPDEGPAGLGVRGCRSRYRIERKRGGGQPAVGS